jgi:hypothetical protein
VVVLARRPAEAASFTIRMEDVEREDAVAVVRMTPLR